MTAMQAAERLGQEFEGADVTLLPMADGGDDTCAVLVTHGWSEVELPSGAVIVMRDDVALVELARICGMVTLSAPDPWGASTWALGVALRDVATLAPRRVMLALGGSASTDGGLGMLCGIHGDRKEGGLTDLVARVAVDQPVQIPPLPYVLSALVDVLRPLTGPTGAAYGFGPQKGLDGDGCRIADDALMGWARLLVIDPLVPGTGAAGGTGAAALALGADLRSGARAIADVIGLAAAVQEADLVVTGEGRLDSSTLAGKSPMVVIESALSAEVPVRCVVGQADPHVAEELRARGVEVVILDT
jgi:glycerate kinase